MYNRYIPNGDSYTRIPMDDSPVILSPPSPPPPEGPVKQQPQKTGKQSPGGIPLPPFLSSLTGGGEGGGGLSGLLRALKLDSLDSGDVLLLLIVLLLLWEGDDLELVIALGLVLIMGLGEEQE